jgi:hypothetical protein
MKSISVTICKTKRGVARPPRLKTRERDYSARELIRWLKQQGAKPLDPATRKRLRAAGHLGMPAE